MNVTEDTYSLKSSCGDENVLDVSCGTHGAMQPTCPHHGSRLSVCAMQTSLPLSGAGDALRETRIVTPTTLTKRRHDTTPSASPTSSSLTTTSTIRDHDTHPLHLCTPVTDGSEDGDGSYGRHHSQNSSSHASMLATSTEDDIHSPLVPESVPVPSRCYDDDDADPDAGRNWSPGRPLRVAYVTWNMANNTASIEQVRTHCIKPNAHLIIVATQENGPFVGSHKMQRRWLKAVQRECLAQRYVLVGKHAMSALHLAVFARGRDVVRYVSHVHCGHVATGSLHHLFGNKGAVAVALAISLDPQPATSPPPAPPSNAAACAVRPIMTVVRGGNAIYSPLEHSLRVCNPLSPDCVAPRRPCPHQALLTARTATTAADTSAAASPRSRTSSAPAFVRGAAQAYCGHEVHAPRCCTLLCINAHLPAHQRAVHLRNAGYRRIVRRLEVGLRGPHRRFFVRLLRLHAGRRGGSNDMLGLDSALSSRCPSQGHEVAAGGGGPSGAPVRRDAGEAGVWRRRARQLGSPSPSGLLSPEVSLLNLRSMFRPQRAAETYRDANDCVEVRRQRRDVTEQFDLTFFGGDLNYRINGVRSAIEATIRLYPHVREILLRNDQLLLEQVKQTVFHGFHEGKLAFRPTYKYEVDPVSRVTQNIYSLSDKKNRLPAYCDRVLFKTRRHSAVRRVGIKLYTDVPNVRSSDHRPVVAIFDIQTRSA